MARLLLLFVLVLPAYAGPPEDATVRIRVERDEVMQFGSGTIISSQPGRTLVLTCDHVFEGVKYVEVELAGNSRRSVPATIVLRDEPSDVALVLISDKEVFPFCPVATVAPAARDVVYSVGFNHGLRGKPRVDCVVVSLSTATGGPHWTLCTKGSVFGRSGGGLFNARGEVVGVTSGYIPKTGIGVYVGFDHILDAIKKGQ